MDLDLESYFLCKFCGHTHRLVDACVHPSTLDQERTMYQENS